LRYLAWDPNLGDTTDVTDFADLPREEDQPLRCEHDRRVLGLFSRNVSPRLLDEVGLCANALPFDHREVPPGPLVLFVAVKPTVESP
jgi:hypothetical protein